jgi:putative phosphoribosyl transferase
MKYQDRIEAGQQLAAKLMAYANRPDVLVLGLARGGVPVAFEVAEALGVPLDVFVVRKLGVPGYEELAMGAIASGGVRVLNEDVMHQLDIVPEFIQTVAAREQRILEYREHFYRDEQPAPEVQGRTVILVDDGLATGATMRAAVAALRQRQPARLVIAVPVAASSTCEELRAVVDEVVCAATPKPFQAVGLWYEDFSATSDAEVRDLLARASQRQATTASR